MTVIDFAHARRTRGLYALAGPGRLDRPSAHALRHWRCYHARLTQRDAARAAGVSVATYQRAESGADMAAHTRARLAGWAGVEL